MLKWGIRPSQLEGTPALLAGHMTQAEPMTGHRGLLPEKSFLPLTYEEDAVLITFIAVLSTVRPLLTMGA